MIRCTYFQYRLVSSYGSKYAVTYLGPIGSWKGQGSELQDRLEDAGITSGSAYLIKDALVDIPASRKQIQHLIDVWIVEL